MGIKHVKIPGSIKLVVGLAGWLAEASRILRTEPYFKTNNSTLKTRLIGINNSGGAVAYKLSV